MEICPKCTKRMLAATVQLPTVLSALHPSDCKESKIGQTQLILRRTQNLLPVSVGQDSSRDIWTDIHSSSPGIRHWSETLFQNLGPRDHAPTVGAPLTNALLQQNSNESQGFLSDKSLQKTPRKETSDSKFPHALPFRLWVNWNKMKPLPGNTARMTIFKSILKRQALRHDQ